MSIIRFIASLLLVAGSSGFVSGQLTAPGADFTDTTIYRIQGVADSIYVFYSPNELIRGELVAKGPVAGNFDFEWEKYDSTLKSWSALSSESDVPESRLAGLDEGGYRVRVKNGSGTDTLFRAWIHLNSLNLTVLSDASDHIQFGKYFCGVLYLNAGINTDSFYYDDLNTGERILRSPALSYIWTSDNPEMTIFNPTVGYASKSIENPPFKDTWFILTAADYSGMTDQDSVFYPSIEVRSEFSMEFFDKKEDQDFEVPSTYEDDAPLTVRFTNKSVNGHSYEWIYADTSGTFGTPVFRNYFTSSFDEQPEFTYKIPGDYYPMLVAESEEGCIDTFKLDEAVKVLPSELEAPNVFSPEGLEANRFFKVRFQSIKEFHIRIYTRTGNLVYKADVTDMYAWDGWDGNIMNSSRPAPPGMYYYIIEATGFDEIRYNRGPYKGVVYLFRPKD